jgi:hypothetical protein
MALFVIAVLIISGVTFARWFWIAVNARHHPLCLRDFPHRECSLCAGHALPVVYGKPGRW